MRRSSIALNALWSDLNSESGCLVTTHAIPVHPSPSDQTRSSTATSDPGHPHFAVVDPIDTIRILRSESVDPYRRAVSDSASTSQGRDPNSALNVAAGK